MSPDSVLCPQIPPYYVPRFRRNMVLLCLATQAGRYMSKLSLWSSVKRAATPVSGHLPRLTAITRTSKVTTPISTPDKRKFAAWLLTGIARMQPAKSAQTTVWISLIVRSALDGFIDFFVAWGLCGSGMCPAGGRSQHLGQQKLLIVEIWPSTNFSPLKNFCYRWKRCL